MYIYIYLFIFKHVFLLRKNCSGLPFEKSSLSETDPQDNHSQSQTECSNQRMKDGFNASLLFIRKKQNKKKQHCIYI